MSNNEPQDNCQYIVKIYAGITFIIIMLHVAFNKEYRTVPIFLCNMISLIFCSVVLSVICNIAPRFAYLIVLIIVLITVINLYNKIGCAIRNVK